jgi:hypothetical protein
MPDEFGSVTISGSSDDLIEVGGAISEEFTYEDKPLDLSELKRLAARLVAGSSDERAQAAWDAAHQFPSIIDVLEGHDRLEEAARHACDAFDQPIVADENGSTDWCAKDIAESMSDLREVLDASRPMTIQEIDSAVLEARADAGFEAMVELVRRRTAEEDEES